MPIGYVGILEGVVWVVWGHDCLITTLKVLTTPSDNKVLTPAASAGQSHTPSGVKYTQVPVRTIQTIYK